MPTKVIMPQMGESIFEGTITKWLKQLGEKVSRDEPLFEISTDKVDSEIPAPAEGILTEILVPAGKTVQINTVVAMIESEAAVAEARTTAPATEAAAASEPQVETVAAKTLSSGPQDAGEPAKSPPTAGRIQVAAPPTVRSAAAPALVPAPDIRTSPLVRRLAREHSVDLSRVAGTGLGGRITREDLQNYIEQKQKAGVEIPKPAQEQAPTPPAQPVTPAEEAVLTAPVPAQALPLVPESPRFIGDSETVPMSPMRKAISERMVLSRHTSAHVSTVFEVDMTAIVAVREKQKDEFEKREGIKLTFTPFFVKALVDTVREFPIFNSSVSGDAIIYKKPINVGIAVALEHGLIVPVVKDAHLKSFTGLILSINDLAERARNKRLKPEDVQNGTISITNPGIYGSLFGTPIISQPQVAILGIGGIEKRPVVIHDAIAVRSMVYLSLSFDHRIIDGAVADQFMARLKAILQGWTKWVE